MKRRRVRSFRIGSVRSTKGVPVRVVIDTDAANEIDDQFALAWALLSPGQLQVDAVYAAPFSFAHRRSFSGSGNTPATTMSCTSARSSSR